jgi:cytochrome c5
LTRRAGSIRAREYVFRHQLQEPPLVRNYDLEFLKKFSMVIGFLMLLTLGLMVGAYYVHLQLPPEVSPVAAKRTADRIAPVGSVYAGSTGAAAQAAATAAAAAAAASQVAYGGTLDGSVIYGQLCTGCHTSGAGGAPTMDKAHWAARIAQGTETLHKHAIEGFTGSAGVMPAKGGNPALTDEQVKATVDWMVANLK